jgi:polyisoprenoid-binding protein YceI
MLKILCFLTLLGSSAFVLPKSESTTPAAPGTYEIDAAHSSVIFGIKHKGVANFYGCFRTVTGKVIVGEDQAQASVTIEIDAASVDTRSEGRDKHIRSPDFLNAKQFPVIRFQSSKVNAKGDHLRIVGELTCHGKSKEIEVTARFTGFAEGDRGTAAGWETRFTFLRSDFGMNHLIGPLGDEISMVISLECKKL